MVDHVVLINKYSFRTSFLILFLILFSLIQTSAIHAADFSPGCTAGVGDAAALANAVSEANDNREADTITLMEGCTYTLDNTLTLRRNGGTLTINGNGATIQGNNVRVFRVNEASLTLDTLTISGIDSNQNGGGIHNYEGSLTISNSTFSGNSARFDGGGIYNDEGNVTIRNSTFSNNSAADGGAIYSDGGTITIDNSTFADNSARVDGGSIYNYRGALSIHNSTLAGNSAADGGGIYTEGRRVNMSNSIVTGNTRNDCVGAITLSDQNLGCGGSVSGDALLDVFDGTVFPLLSGSAAIDTSSTACPSDDQIGQPCFDGDGDGVLERDLGSFEAQAA